MSRERARRREARLADTRRRIEAERKRLGRRSRWRALKARLRPNRGRVGRLPGKYSRAQTKIAAGALLALVVLTFYATNSWPVRVAAVALALLCLPVLLTISFDRRSR